MKMSFKDHVKSKAFGLLGLGAPAALINHFTYDVSPMVVLFGVTAAGLTGYSFAAWSISRSYDEASDE